MIEPTAVESYRAGQRTGLITQRKSQVLQFIREHDSDEGVSQGDVARHFDDASSSFQPRFRELEIAGLIAVVGTKRDPVTGRPVKAYRATARTMPNGRKRKRTQATLQPMGDDCFRVTFQPALAFAETTTIDFCLAI